MSETAAAPPANALASDLAYVETHRRVWARKQHLRAVYGRYHDLILAHCPREARVLELATGLGHLTEAARERGHARWLATDILPVRDAGLRCDATALPFASASLDRIVFIDMLHHLGAPKAFAREAGRVLRPGGEVVCVEPWITLASYPFWRYVHHEGCDLSRDVEHPFPAGAGKAAYEGDGGLATLVVKKIPAEEWQRLGFKEVTATPFNDYAYLSTRGFQETSDAPGVVFGALRLGLDRALSPFARWLGLRALIRWVRA